MYEMPPMPEMVGILLHFSGRRHSVAVDSMGRLIYGYGHVVLDRWTYPLGYWYTHDANIGSYR